MTTISVRGYTIERFIVKDSFNRRATQLRNSLIQTLKEIGVTEESVDIPLEPFALKKAPSSCTWFFEGHRLYYSYELCGKFVENLYVVLQIIKREVEAFLRHEKTKDEFVNGFSEDEDVVDQRKQARKVLGVEENTNDLRLINKRYRDLAKEHHPDRATGNTEKFKTINKAHKLLKRELE